jgi:acyl-CoA thioester hydrolase
VASRREGPVFPGSARLLESPLDEPVPPGVPSESSNAVARSVFRWPVRVYYEDTDAGGIVYYANYLRFFERARTEWLRSLGGPSHSEIADARDEVFVVRGVSIEYLRPARLDDMLELELAVAEGRRASLTLR